jgi:L-ascorbate metabolism protein UlaG (beta-lactamase superfamily)
MTYPLSDHFDGTHFFNPEPTIRNSGNRKFSFFSILRARWKRDSSEWSSWPKNLPPESWPAPGPVAPGQTSVTFIGHSTFLIRFAGLTVLTVILLSHNHYDHCDLPSLRKLRKRFPEAKIVTTLGNAPYLAKKRLFGAVELDWWQAHEMGETKITAVPARHFAARWLNDWNETLWAGFMLEHEGTRIYFAGDTGYTKFFTEIAARLGSPDLALLPIGAYEPRWFMGPVHMNPQDAVQAFADLGAKQAIGMHFGTFQLTAEAIGAPERDLSSAKSAANLPASSFVTLGFGETRIFQHPNR